ncbi:hypothetical protein [Haladaptatus sp. CMAA 1911]|uniref:hypothetical protein n=1 Tax=unclassified Haladaptatus TaxID=2622732 RepID=UPI003754A37D
MKIITRSVLRKGVGQLKTRNGLLLVGCYFVIDLLLSGLTSITSSTYLPLQTDSMILPANAAQPVPPATDIPVFVSLAATLLTLGLTTAITTPIQIIAIRIFASDCEDRIPERFVFYRMGWATVHTYLGAWVGICIVVGIILVSVALGIGLVFVIGESTLTAATHSFVGVGLVVIGGIVLLIPAFILFTGLTFIAHEIAIQDRNIFQACLGSWRLASQHLVAFGILSVTFLILPFGIFALLPAVAPPIISDISISVVSTLSEFLYLSLSTILYCRMVGIDLSRQSVFEHGS